MSPLSKPKGLQKIRVVLLVDCVVQLYSNRFTIWRILTVLYCIPCILSIPNHATILP